ncbi:MAG TPA: DUF6152 family protein [Steroidobacteraceae bacterium]|jgi:hypothetical protein
MTTKSALAVRVVPLLVLFALADSALAHHSFALFDFKSERELEGTVKEFQWNNPHCFIQLLVAGGGGTQEWSIEMTSPLHLLQNGWGPRLVKAGDALVVTIHPIRDGGHAGSYVRARTRDGAPIDPPPPPGKRPAVPPGGGR